MYFVRKRVHSAKSVMCRQRQISPHNVSPDLSLYISPHIFA